MIETKAIPWNTEYHLETPEDIGAYLEAVFENGDPGLISHALGAVAPLKGHDGARPSHRLGSAKPV